MIRLFNGIKELYKHKKSLFLAGAFVSALPMSVDALERAKVDGNNNLVTAYDTPLRGAPFFLDRFGVGAESDGMEANEAVYEQYFNSAVQNYKINLVRCSPWIGDHEYFNFDAYQPDHEARYTYMLDKCVDWAENNDIYAIVNYHSKYKTVLEPWKVNGFWSIYAPRYKDRKHVIYELVNEPESQSIQQSMQGIYDHARALAPDTHMILWSLYDPSEVTAAEIKSATPTINYQTDNVSVGWHNYWDNGNMTAWDRAEDYAANGLPVINTEFWSLRDRNELPISYGNIAENVRIGEELGRSWILWAPYLNYEAKNKGYSHDDLKFTPEFEDAVRNGARTISYGDTVHNAYAAGLNGQYWDKWSPSINPNGNSSGSAGAANYSDDVNFASVANTYDLSGNFTVSVNYSAGGDRDLVLEVFRQNDGAWLGQKVSEVSAGSGTKSITASIGAISQGDYKLKIGIRQRGGAWYDSLKDVYRDNVPASSGSQSSSGNSGASTKPTISLNAGSANAVSDGVQQYAGWGVGYYGPNRWVKFSQVNLGVGGYDRVKVRTGTTQSGTIEVRAQNPNGPLLTTININGSDYSDLKWHSASFPNWEYSQDLYFVMRSTWANFTDLELIDE